MRRWLMDTSKDTQMALYVSRVKLKREMARALSCIKPAAKRALAAEWRETYSELFYKELIRCAKNKAVAATISEWNLDSFDKQRKQ
jgi:hypothetical protein